jgi:hypothetical protein
VLAEAGGCLGRVETRWKLFGCGDGGARCLQPWFAREEAVVGGRTFNWESCYILTIGRRVAYLLRFYFSGRVNLHCKMLKR